MINLYLNYQIMLLKHTNILRFFNFFVLKYFFIEKKIKIIIKNCIIKKKINFKKFLYYYYEKYY